MEETKKDELKAFYYDFNSLQQSEKFIRNSDCIVAHARKQSNGIINILFDVQNNDSVKRMGFVILKQKSIAASGDKRKYSKTISIFKHHTIKKTSKELNILMDYISDWVIKSNF